MSWRPLDGAARPWRATAVAFVVGAAAGATLLSLVSVFPTRLPAVRLAGQTTAAAASSTAPGPAATSADGGTAGFALPPGRPAWCDTLLASPLPANAGCHPTDVANCGPGRPPRFYGQFGQDAWLYAHHFRSLRRPGVFLDVAANEAMDISNTYVFEACLGWKGVCVEPNTRYLRALHDQRSCELVPLCVSDVPKTVSFIDYLGLSGIADTNKNLNSTAAWQAPVRSAPRRELQCTTVAAVMRRSGLTRVDFLSLDVEGAELDVLRGIDWEAVQIDVIALEEETAEATALKFLVAKGYKPVYFNPARKEDILCFHPNVTVGRPTP